MIRAFILLLLAGPVLAVEPRTGDIIFHSSRSAQAKDIEAVTGSRYSHCGVIEVTPDGSYTWEATGPVRRVSLDDFIEAGRGGRYALYRPKNELTPEQFDRMLSEARRVKGRAYDRLFEPDDEKVYCSELVWMAYKAAGIELCALRPFKDYPISKRLAAAKKRWGKELPMEQLMVSPQDLAESKLLECIKDME